MKFKKMVFFGFILIVITIVSIFLLLGISQIFGLRFF